MQLHSCNNPRYNPCDAFIMRHRMNARGLPGQEKISILKRDTYREHPEGYSVQLSPPSLE